MSALRTITLSLILPLLLSTSAVQAAEHDNSDASGVLQRISSFTDRATNLAIEAMSLVGIHYRRGGNSPEHGLDCSGLVRYVFKQSNDIDLPRTSVEMSRVGEQVDKKDLQPGDLVFFNTLRRTFSHVGIYLGDNKFIHAPTPGSAVRVESMDLNYWKARFNGARRVLDSENSEPARR
ncbi:MAG: peptidoglycan endopeptidase [Oxalobacteraceae bacterium]|jgi:cell wall-associated NlpC family hydrolase|nr:peptidoglycan endopeptidase [Oxalobacteraceae bacterium]